jgi:hypothetical protein
LAPYVSLQFRRDALDDIVKINERIDLQVLTGLHQRTQDGGAMRRRFTARKQPVLAVNASKRTTTV